MLKLKGMGAKKYENYGERFLHKIIEGSASRSYGIHVARLAGVPQQLLYAAENKLNELEESGASIDLNKYTGRTGEEEAGLKAETEQISFFSFAPNPVLEKLKSLDLMNITPSKAFEILEELKKAAEE